MIIKIFQAGWTGSDPDSSSPPDIISIISLVATESSPTTALISLILTGEEETDCMMSVEMKLAVWGERKEKWSEVRQDHWLVEKNLTARGAME